LLNLLLQLVHFLLGLDEPLAHRIVQEGVAFGIEGGHLAAIQGESLVLAFVQRAAFFRQALVLLLRAGVSQEGIDALADALKLRLLDNGFAQFHSLLADHIFSLSIGMHKFP